MRIIGVIPARLKSTRFPNKILAPIGSLPMIEHVRRRALLCRNLADVIVATCDEEIANVVHANGGRVIMTSDTHINGTTRVAEAVCEISCTHVLLLQGDEPLLLPRHVESLTETIVNDPDVPAWNLVSTLESEDELDRHALVKCLVGSGRQVLYTFRRSPSFSDFKTQKIFVRKMLGAIAYRRDFLLKLSSFPALSIERSESIEQLRILESGFRLHCVEVTPGLPSVNEPEDLQAIITRLAIDSEQQQLLKAIMNMSTK